MNYLMDCPNYNRGNKFITIQKSMMGWYEVYCTKFHKIIRLIPADLLQSVWDGGSITRCEELNEHDLRYLKEKEEEVFGMLFSCNYINQC